MSYTPDAFNPSSARVSATTASDGRYTLTLANPGGYRNFEPATRVVGRGVNGIQRLDIEMTPR